MKLTDILVPDACRIEMEARTKKEALRELATGLADAVDGLEGSELLDMLLEREKLGTTAMGDGIAIPHARIESLDRVLASFGRCREGEEAGNRVKADLRAGREAGVSGTPAFFINGILLSGARPLEAFVEVIERELQLRGGGA